MMNFQAQSMSVDYYISNNCDIDRLMNLNKVFFKSRANILAYGVCKAACLSIGILPIFNAII